MNRVAVGSLLSLALTVSPLRAQVVSDGATNTLSNVTNTFTGDVTVGTNGSFTLLVLSNNALLTNSANGNIGLNANARSNEVRLVSPTARWLLGSQLAVGSSGAFNRLVISNGAAVRANIGSLGLNVSASNNFALITGAGSVWSNASTFRLGFNGAGNQLIVSNGGVLHNNSASVGLNSSSPSNLAIITGSGSLWSNRSDLQFGFNGAGSRLVVSNGGFVRSRIGALGVQANASNTLGVITGPGSTWSNAAELYVGLSGPNNQLTVSDGGTAQAAFGYVGANATATNNLALITGSGSVWNNALDLNIGSFSANNRMIVSNGATVFAAGNGLIGPTANGNGNSVTVTDPGSLWRVASSLYVGSNGALSRLTISNGGLMANRLGVIGNHVSSSNNVALVTGSGSVWSNASELHVGDFSAGNQLVISNGGFVSAQSGEIGSEGGSVNNLVLVMGSGSKWSNTNLIYIGNYGVSNRLVVAEGGAVDSADGYIGGNSTASNNSVLVTGAGSVWTNANSLYVGSSGAGNQLVVSNGATAFGYEGLIGSTSSSSNNLAVVTGAGSLWSNAVDLFVGNDGRNNQLIVTNGGTVRGQVGTVGLNASGSNNLVVVTGVGSLWTNDQALFVGNSGGGNSLVVSNGGTVSSSDGIIGLNSTSDNNVALVTEPGSSWNMAGDLAVGFTGDGNRLVVSNSGRVLNNFGVMLSHSNEVIVTGAGSLWSNRLDVIVGGLGRGNRLVVNDGGTVLGGNVFVGQESTSTNNRVVVDAGTLLVTNMAGTGVLDIRRGTNVLNAGLMDVDQLVMTNTLSRFEFNGGTLITRGAVISNSLLVVGNTGNVPAVWDVRAGASNHFMAGGVYVGGAGSFAQLIHTNGALLTNGAEAALGRDATSHSNSVTLAGSGSRWWLGDGVLVGDGGSGNRLVVRDGASLVTTSISYFGDDTTSTNNEAVVTGPGSSWFTADYGLRVGYEGPNNRLLVSDGGVVTSFDDRIGNDLSSSNNQVLVIDSGSLWNNTRELTVGLNSTGNQLVVSNGGTVFTVANKYIGQNDGALSNTAIVTGPGSAWLGDDSLYVGLDGSFNRLFIRNGGRVTSGITTLGGSLGADGNQALITDAGSVWSNRFDLNVGGGGSANQLVISNGGAIVSASDGFIGRNSGANSNAVILTDVGTRWLLSSNFYVGSNGAFSRLTVTSGARLENTFASIGVGISGSNNDVLITGAGSIWTNRSLFHLGESGRSNQMIVSNGGRVDSPDAEIGFNASSSNNQVLIIDPGSFVRVDNTLVLGSSSGGNRLVVSNGASLHNDNAHIGFFGTNNEIVITGPGTTWTNRSGIQLGRFRGGNRLFITDQAFVFAREVFIGLDPQATNNRATIDGGTLLVTNSTGAGALDVLRGTNVLNAGLIDIARLSVTNELGQFEFNGGKLVTSGTAIANGRMFTIGNGASAATFALRNGTHSFANNLAVLNNASLVGDGTINGTLTVQTGGTISPGTSIGKIVLSDPPLLQGATIMEISKDGTSRTNDLIQMTGTLTYGGTLTVSNLGPTALTAGDNFKLFSAGTYAGEFTTLALPPLDSGLEWTNRLLLDGSIEVIGLLPPAFSRITATGTNVIVVGTNGTPGANYAVLTATNISLPVNNWFSLFTNQFNAGGGFSFTNGIAPNELQRYFRIRTP
jgi:T5SS/PEP-CTERM-associated repeat protein